MSEGNENSVRRLHSIVLCLRGQRRPLAASVRSLRLCLVLGFGLLPSNCLRASDDIEELYKSVIPGKIETWEGPVKVRKGAAAETLPELRPHPLERGDGLHTYSLGNASVTLIDKSKLFIRELSRLEIEPGSTNSGGVGVRIQQGEVYFSSRGGPKSIPIATPWGKTIPKGTEFLIRVDPAASLTEVTMFDGQAELSNGADTKVVRSGFQGTAIAGGQIEIRSIQAENIVQWWIYYPGLLDPAELGLTTDEQMRLSDSLGFYSQGNLQQALQKYPGYPTPPEPSSDAVRIYYCGLVLTVGAVDRANAQLSALKTNVSLARALRTMIRAVSMPEGFFKNGKGGERSSTNASLGQAAKETLNVDAPNTATEWLALSYAFQATNDLKRALNAARKSISRSPQFGFGWARVAELEFCFGRTAVAREAVQKALKFNPQNAQARAVNGFLLASQNRIQAARAEFDESIRMDSSLANAWLGRGLCRIRQGDSEAGRDDLHTAAILEPTRSLIRSYAGKAFSDAGNERLARKELEYAIKLDANDPTPWLYSALEKWQQNRANEAVRDLEKSIKLNDNRALFRSRLLLDQDRAVRSASLAKIYQSAGLAEASLAEACKAVSYDYANHSAHQFLAESYNTLRDPNRFNLRYETVWFNELLLANVLSPVGTGLLSQNISQQEYSQLFERDRLGFSTSTEFRSDHRLREIASQYGLLGSLSYTLDLDYQHNEGTEGTRRNNDLNRIEWYSQLKYQLTPKDSVFLLAKYQDYESGDNFQHYNPADASPNLRLRETQAPILVGTLHREWQPGVHTTLLAGRLHSDVDQSGSAALFDLWTNSAPPGINWVRVQSFDRAKAMSAFTAYLAELNQIWQTERHLSILGARTHYGKFNISSTIADSTPSFVQDYYGTLTVSDLTAKFWRWSAYGYHTFEIWPHFRLTGGFSYDHLSFPEDFRFPPLSSQRKERDLVLPKASLQWDIHPWITVRGAYFQSLGGLSYDESVRLEPAQLAGFPQAFRNVISEAEVGSVVAPRYEVGAIALNMKLRAATYFGVQGQWLRSDVEQTIGVFRSTGNFPPPPQATPSSTRESLRYEEQSLGVSLDQLLGDYWTVGASYRLERSKLKWFYPEIPEALPLSPNRSESALLHRVQLRLQYQHPSGFFSRAQAHWYVQENRGYGQTIYSGPRPDESAYQVDLFLGYRFLRRRAEITLGVLNLTEQDYRLNSLTPYEEIPRERVWLARARFNF